jgi:hypothetical protein
VTLLENKAQNKEIKQRIENKNPINSPPVKFYFCANENHIESTLGGFDSLK